MNTSTFSIPYIPSWVSWLGYINDYVTPVSVLNATFNNKSKQIYPYIVFSVSHLSNEYARKVESLTRSNKTSKISNRQLILPALPLSNMYDSEAIRARLQHVGQTLEYPSSSDRITYKQVRIHKSKIYLNRYYPKEVSILKKYYISEIPELYWHLYNSIHILKLLSQKIGYKIESNIISTLLLHDLGKPIYLLISQYKKTIELLKDFSVEELKERLVSNNMDGRSLGKYAESIILGKKIELPTGLEKYQKCNKDDDISHIIVKDLHISSNLQNTLDRYWSKNSFNQRDLLLVKVSDILSDYYEIVKAGLIYDAIEIKARAVAKTYLIQYKDILNQYRFYVDTLFAK